MIVYKLTLDPTNIHAASDTTLPIIHVCRWRLERQPPQPSLPPGTDAPLVDLIPIV